jgi:intracellular sulfur oxidation DsrE/DsrF family protein
MLAGLVMLVMQAMPLTAVAQDKSKVVLQVSDNDPAKWNLALNNASNLQKDLGKDNVEIQIVAFGPGINMLKAESEVGNRVQEAKDAGIKTVACQNTMRKANLKQDDMLTSIGYVPSGVVELVKKQQQGYAYLRP